MTPLDGSAMSCGSAPFLNGFVTVMPPPALKRIVVLPVNVYAGWAAVASFAFVGGIVSIGVAVASGDANCELPAHPLPPRRAQPGAGPETSTLSAALRPKT